MFSDGEPDVVFMVRDPENKGYRAGDGKLVDEYDKAIALQQESIAGKQAEAPEPENWVKAGAQEFAQQHGRAITTRYLPIDPRVKSVADAYEAMKHDPTDPKGSCIVQRTNEGHSRAVGLCNKEDGD